MSSGSANTKPSSTNTSDGLPTAEKMRAVCNVINKIRIAKGWGILPASEAELSASVWLEILDRHFVPHEVYNELYNMAISANARKRSEGRDAPELTPEYLISFWVGLEGLKTQMARVSEAHQLTENTGEPCKLCGGTGWKEAEKDGIYRSVTRCHH